MIEKNTTNGDEDSKISENEFWNLIVPVVVAMIYLGMAAAQLMSNFYLEQKFYNWLQLYSSCQ